MPSPHAEVDAFLSETTHPLVANVQHLRVVILASDPRITERITWNAPSFGLGNSDPVTMNLRSGDAVMLMFHRGVKPKPFADFAFDDPSRLLKWAAPDCATATFRSLDAFESNALDLRSLVVRWITATTWAGFPRFKRPYVFQPPHSAANSNVELDYE